MDAGNFVVPQKQIIACVEILNELLCALMIIKMIAICKVCSNVGYEEYGVVY